MRMLIQRVSKAKVEVAGASISEIGHGLLILLGIEEADSDEDVTWLVKKVSQMRVFSDQEGRMNKSVLDIDGSLLVVSQFTLHASTKKGNRPSFIKAASPDVAIPLYEKFVNECRKLLSTQTGEFGADMQVSMVNDGPVTIWLDSKSKE